MSAMRSCPRVATFLIGSISSTHIRRALRCWRGANRRASNKAVAQIMSWCALVTLFHVQWIGCGSAICCAGRSS